MDEFDENRSNRYVDIIECTRRGMSERVAHYIGTGDDVNEKDYNGDYAVVVAAERNDFKILKMLVDAGARLDVQKYVSPLQWARHNKNQQMIDYIVEKLRDPKYNK